MIIQCRQCRTKFRFADDLMEGEGIWLRCSHCQHVFFQDNPLAVKSGNEPGAQEAPSLPEETMPERVGDEEDVALFLDNVMKAKNGPDQESIPEIEKPFNEERSDNENAAASESKAEEDKQGRGKTSRKGFRKILTVAIWIFLVIAVIPSIVYFYIFPQMGDRLLRFVNQYIDIGIREPARPEIVVGQVKLQDIRQRILDNYILGPIRIVEGTAVNQADYPISRVAIKGEIVDAYAVVLGERTAYAGNVLTDEELTALPEEAIFNKLASPEGSNNSNDKIMPNGMIPFMIVFVREPAGVIKTTVKTVGAERLLSN
ncbi:MAG: zinc-ribbon domain-containing protein [Smithellaceae bacterium]